jgi:hypothetical protein
MVTFMFFEASCFLLAQIATTFMIISNWGVEDIPIMILLVGACEVPKTFVARYFEQWNYQRTMVANVLILTQIMFVALRVCYVELPDHRKSFSAVTFIVVEIAVAYNLDAFWTLVEESCNIQQAKKVLQLVNYGQVFAMAFVGFGVALIPWYFYLVPADLLTVGSLIMIPNTPLMMVVAPKDVKTATMARMDRELAHKKAVKDKKKAKADMLKAVRKGIAGQHQLMADDFHVITAESATIFAKLAADPLIPAMGMCFALMFTFDAIYNWQFFTQLEAAVRKDYPQCSTHGLYGATAPRVCTDDFYAGKSGHKDATLSCPRPLSAFNMTNKMACADSCKAEGSDTTTGLPEAWQWSDHTTWDGIEPTTRPCMFCLLDAFKDLSAEDADETIFDDCNGMIGNQYEAGDSKGDCPYITGRDEILDEGEFQLKVDFRANLATIVNVPPSATAHFQQQEPGWTLAWLPRLEVFDDDNKALWVAMYETLPLDTKQCPPGACPPSVLMRGPAAHALICPTLHHELLADPD